jgi:Xaa-Pro aminopeptidase
MKTDARIRNAQELAGEMSLDALIATSPENSYYTSGTQILTTQMIRDRLAITLIPRNGEPCFMVCTIEEKQARAESGVKDIRTYVEFEKSPVALAVEVAKEKGLETARIGFEAESLTARYFQELTKGMPNARFLPCDHLFDLLRMRKTVEESELLQKAARITEKAIARCYESSKPGDTEKKMAFTMSSSLLELGAESIAFNVLAAGTKNSLEAHHLPTQKRIARGDIVRVDVGGWFSGYLSDLVRMASVGRPSKNKRSIYERLVSIQRSIIDQAQPGAKVSDLYRLCSQAFQAKSLRFTMPHIGHSMGLKVHEYPMINPMTEQTLEPGMTIAIEPLCVDPSEGLFHIEDLVLVTKRGPKILSDATTTDEMHVI